MEIRNQIEQYIPFNEQEVSDKEYFVEWLNNFDNLLTRENNFAHFSSSAFVVNKDKTKMLVVWHNIYGAWIYPGGHADGEENLLNVAIREVEEETGLKVIPLSDSIYGIQALPTKGHIKINKYISSHTHLDVIYLLEADDKLPLKMKEDENSGVKWIPLSESFNDDIVDFVRPVNEKLVKKLQLKI